MKKKGLDPDEYAACKAHIEAKKAGMDAPPRLTVKNIVTVISGRASHYHISMDDKALEIIKDAIPFDKLDDLIEDLKAIKEAYIHE